MTTPSYSVPLQVAAFTFAVNSAADLSFASIDEMQDYVTKIANVNLADATLQAYVGSDWELVWGPVVWVNPNQQGSSFVADNTMACYYSPSQSLFIIAIAGTNPSSMFDWEKEDFDITTMISWNSISAGAGANSGYISAGSANGLDILMNQMEDGSASLISALQSYIQTNTITNATIAIGGHSLGGALAPCLGLYFLDNADSLQLTGQDLAVYVYAGPTPGDENFAAYYTSNIDISTFSYLSQYNPLDIIPMGSAIADLGTIAGIYGTNIPYGDTPTNTFTGVLATGMQFASLAGGLTSGAPYTQISENFNPSTGSTFNIDVYTNCSEIIAGYLKKSEDAGISATYMSEVAGFVSFLYQAAAQHGPAYCGGTISLPLPKLFNLKNIWTSAQVTGFLGIDDYTIEYQSNLANNPPTNATYDSGVARVIKKFTSIDLSNMQMVKLLAPSDAAMPA
jgi:hypothetical protein